MAAQKLRRTVDDDIGAQRQRVLIDRRGEGVVHHDECPRSVRCSGESGNIDDFECGIGRALEIEHGATLEHGALECVMVIRLAQRYLDLIPWQELREQLARPAVRVLDRHHTIAGLEQREQRVADRGHARCEARRRFGVLEEAHLVLERLDGRIRVPAVNVSAGFPERYALPRIQIVIAERDAVYDRDLGRTLEPRLVFAAPDGDGVHRFLTRRYGHGDNNARMARGRAISCRSERETSTEYWCKVGVVQVGDAGAVRNGDGQTAGHARIRNSGKGVQPPGEVMIRVERPLVEGARA